MTRWLVVLLAPLAVACGTSGAIHGAAAHACVPGQNVYCLCPGGASKGTQLCLENGQSFGACQPCEAIPTEDLGSEADAVALEDATAADDLGSSGGELGPDLGVDSGADLGSDVAVGMDADAAPDMATDAATVFSDGKCPGEKVLLDAYTDKVWNGNTTATLASSLGEGTCAAAVGQDAAYQIEAAERGRVTVKVAGFAGFDPVAYVRSGGCTGKQIACADDSGAGAKETLQVYVVPGTPLYVFVDSKGKAGDFSAWVHFQPGVFCGDGLVDPEEACDDGNQIDGDGCSAACKPDAFPKESGTCPGQTVHVWSLPVEVSATTVPFTNTQSGSCGGKSGRDAIYAIVPHSSGTLTATITKTDFDTVLYARESPCSSGKELGCSNALKAVGGEKLSVPATLGQVIYLLVDGWNYGKGSFHLLVQVE